MKMPTQSLNLRERGFTLIELLTVIAIIGVLASILTVVIGEVRTKALRTQTASNLRQIHVASTLYMNDNNGYLPNSFVSADVDLGRPANEGWWNQLVNGGYLTRAGNSTQKYQILGSPIQWREAPEVTIRATPPNYVTFGMNYPLTGVAPGATRTVTINKVLAPARTLFVSEGRLESGKTFFSVSVSYAATPTMTDGIVTHIYVDGRVKQMREDEFPTALGAKYSDSWYFWRGRE